MNNFLLTVAEGRARVLSLQLCVLPGRHCLCATLPVQHPVKATVARQAELDSAASHRCVSCGTTDVAGQQLTEATDSHCTQAMLGVDQKPAMAAASATVYPMTTCQTQEAMLQLHADIRRLLQTDEEGSQTCHVQFQGRCQSAMLAQLQTGWCSLTDPDLHTQADVADVGVGVAANQAVADGAG